MSAISPARIKLEFYRRSERFHVIACALGALLNLVWVVCDYFLYPEHVSDFFIFRFAVSVGGVCILWFREKLRFSVTLCTLILVIGIAIQDAYMLSYLDVEQYRQFTFGYIALFLGTGMLVLWETKYSLLLIAVTLFSNVFFFWMNARISIGDVLVNGGLVTISMMVFTLFMIRSRYKTQYNETSNRLYLEKSKAMLESKHRQVMEQKTEIEEMNETILSSIRYAKRIQSAMLPSASLLNAVFNDFFVFYKPKDIVSGDFFWVGKTRDMHADGGERTLRWCALADCTGHGVPGAFLTFLGSNNLQTAVVDKHINIPGKVLDFLHSNIKAALYQDQQDSKVQDGMDIVLLAIDEARLELHFAGANGSICIVRDGNLTRFKTDKQAIGASFGPSTAFNTQVCSLQKGDMIYAFSDGFADQFGGPQGKKLNSKNLRSELLKVAQQPVEHQKIALSSFFEKWKGELEQTDDVCVIGIRIS